jgi:hypothetical protein
MRRIACIPYCGMVKRRAAESIFAGLLEYLFPRLSELPFNIVGARSHLHDAGAKLIFGYVVPGTPVIHFPVLVEPDIRSVVRDAYILVDQHGLSPFVNSE